MGPGSSVPAEEPAADWAPSPPCCQSRPWARPHRTALAATGSLGTGKEAVGGKTSPVSEIFSTSRY